MTLKTLTIFAITEFVLSLSPGPAVFLVISQGMKAGFKSSFAGTIGILTGNAIYFVLSALGLGAILLASATLFQVIKWVGVGYLMAIGIRMLMSKPERKVVQMVSEGQEIRSKRLFNLFLQGLMTQISNPKAIVFFTALLPQFVSVGSDMFYQFIVLGIVSIMVEFPVLVAYGWVAERGSRLIPERFSTLPDRIAGICLMGAGLGLALMKVI